MNLEERASAVYEAMQNIPYNKVSEAMSFHLPKGSPASFRIKFSMKVPVNYTIDLIKEFGLERLYGLYMQQPEKKELTIEEEAKEFKDFLTYTTREELGLPEPVFKPVITAGRYPTFEERKEIARKLEP